MTLPPFNSGFPGGSDGKESVCNAGDQGLILGLGGYFFLNFFAWKLSSLHRSWKNSTRDIVRSFTQTHNSFCWRLLSVQQYAWCSGSLWINKHEWALLPELTILTAHGARASVRQKGLFSASEIEVCHPTGTPLRPSGCLTVFSWAQRGRFTGQMEAPYPQGRSTYHENLCWEPEGSSLLCVAPGPQGDLGRDGSLA